MRREPPATFGRGQCISPTFVSRKGESMRRFTVIAAVLAVLGGVIATAAAVGVGQPSPTTPAAKTPLWVTHVARYSGGISGGVRAMLAASQARASSPTPGRPSARAGSPANNVQ